ncbi:hypothetical protein GCM10022261_21550 [Brevibacterium daeguense]|uniref:Uncharacterized protein n=1 Tax=Brevibacterium daeguense TaxID=909936 RepID=A0ABP8EKZ8_9MICO
MAVSSDMSSSGFIDGVSQGCGRWWSGLRLVPFELYNDCRFRLRESWAPLGPEPGCWNGRIERMNQVRGVKDSVWFVKMNAVNPLLRRPSGRPKEKLST